MKRLIFVIQLMIVFNGLAMADPVISLKTLLYEMTDRSVLARWPEPIRVSSSAATTVVRIT